MRISNALAIGVVLTVSPVLFGQQSMIDQEQPAINNTGGPLAIGGASNQKLAQTFTARRTGILTHVTVPIACDPSATVTVSINNVVATGRWINVTDIFMPNSCQRLRDALSRIGVFRSVAPIGRKRDTPPVSYRE